MSLVIQVCPPGISLTEAEMARIGCTLKVYDSLPAHIPKTEHDPCIFLLHYTAKHIFNQIRAMRRQCPSMPVILTDSEYHDKIALKALRERIWDYVVLPRELEYLHESLVQLSDALAKHYAASQQAAMSFEALPDGPGVRACGRTDKAKNYIEGHFSEKIKVESMANMCRMSLSSFLRHFKAEHGSTVRDFIKTIRLTEAKRLLLNSGKRIKQIAFETGYDDVSHFNRLFKAEMGVTPKAFRMEAFIAGKV